MRIRSTTARYQFATTLFVVGAIWACYAVYLTVHRHDWGVYILIGTTILWFSSFCIWAITFTKPAKNGKKQLYKIDTSKGHNFIQKYNGPSA